MTDFLCVTYLQFYSYFLFLCPIVFSIAQSLGSSSQHNVEELSVPLLLLHETSGLHLIQNFREFFVFILDRTRSEFVHGLTQRQDPTFGPETLDHHVYGSELTGPRVSSNRALTRIISVL